MQRVRPFGELEMRAYHEAGHALVALAEGFRVRRVTILQRGRIGGACESGFSVPRPASLRALRRIVGATAAVALAGSAAQEREARTRGAATAGPRRGAASPLFAAGAEDDERIANRFARRLHPRTAPRRAYLGRVRVRVERALDDPGAWAAVRRLARALLRARTLSGDEAARTARRAIADAIRAPRGPPRPAP